ncbi:hypothetical protein [Nocardia paucivorans]|uniref:hypothetical protein n=1 Tax=Nocardia paucivorans TaxID=114259 RepID=UPI00030A401E|nr:hypothetical protein [Nocardia paucivorans]
MTRVASILAAAVLTTAGATLSALPTAAADPEASADPTRFFDRTDEFVPADSPEAGAARAAGRHLIMSPHGTDRKIVCRGNGTTVPLYDCMQEDLLGWTILRRTETPLGEVWLHLP